MMAKANLTAEQFEALMSEVDEMAHKLSRVEDRWPFVLGQSFPELERHAQTMNRLIENAASAQRMILAGIALGADERRIRAQIEAREA